MRPEEDKFIERLYLDTFQLLWTYAMSKLNNPALAQEVVQDAFLEAIRNIEKLMSHENPRGWMKNTVKNILEPKSEIVFSNFSGQAIGGSVCTIDNQQKII